MAQTIIEMHDVSKKVNDNRVVLDLSYENGKYIVSSSEDKTIQFWMN